MFWRGVQKFLAGFGLGLIAIGLVYSASLAALKVMGYDYAVVASNSMSPVAQRGDLVIVEPSHQAKINQVTLFRQGSALVLHRLVRHNADGSWTSQGDANLAEDPWTVDESSVVGSALGVLRGFGFVMLAVNERGFALSQTSAAHAAFVRRATATAQVNAGFWTTPAVSYTVYANLAAFTGLTSLPTSITFQGDRKLWSSVRYTNLTRIHFEGVMNRSDGGGPGFAFVFNACVNTSDVISCGWQLFFSNLPKSVTLRAFKSDGTLTSALATCSTTADVSGSNTITLNAQSGSMSVAINGTECMRLTAMSTLLNGTGASVPTGGFVGIRAQLSNRLYMPKLYFW